jgi:hypothetical protein
MRSRYTLMISIVCSFSLSCFAMHHAFISTLFSSDVQIIRGRLAEAHAKHKKLVENRENAEHFMNFFNKEAAEAEAKRSKTSDGVLQDHYARAKNIYLGHVSDHKKQLTALSEPIAVLERQIDGDENLLYSIFSRIFF